MQFQAGPVAAPDAFVASRPEFSQFLDRSRPSELVDTRSPALKKQNRWAGNLVYRYLDNGEIAVVPNVWYNQPVAWRIQETRRLIKQQGDELLRLEKNGVAPAEPGRIHFFTPEERRRERMRFARETIARLEAAVEWMERTGVVTH